MKWTILENKLSYKQEEIKRQTFYSGATQPDQTQRPSERWRTLPLAPIGWRTGRSKQEVETQETLLGTTWTCHHSQAGACGLDPAWKHRHTALSSYWRNGKEAKRPKTPGQNRDFPSPPEQLTGLLSSYGAAFHCTCVTELLNFLSLFPISF